MYRIGNGGGGLYFFIRIKYKKYPKIEINYIDFTRGCGTIYGMKKVFYVSYGGGHANISRFIYKELEKDPQVEQEVLSLTVADKIFDRSAFTYKYLTDYLYLAFSLGDKNEVLTFDNIIKRLIIVKLKCLNCNLFLG